jgi:hypothetical protein
MVTVTTTRLPGEQFDLAAGVYSAGVPEYIVGSFTSPQGNVNLRQKVCQATVCIYSSSSMQR